MTKDLVDGVSLGPRIAFTSKEVPSLSDFVVKLAGSTISAAKIPGPVATALKILKSALLSQGKGEGVEPELRGHALIAGGINSVAMAHAASRDNEVMGHAQPTPTVPHPAALPVEIRRVQYDARYTAMTAANQHYQLYSPAEAPTPTSPVQPYSYHYTPSVPHVGMPMTTKITLEDTKIDIPWSWIPTLAQSYHTTALEG
ncbi:hypothetical protein CVT24_003577 [Panaeolus cyanescens]|uniref:Uncharacterized protein n=1 Tax=Panaeolus cyanescens TaxID=181874 RepID=A0A409Y7H3_9AGAR|nr:hypothetical protein CVT24_003577 [Panaeolus cyanescens]